MTLLHKTTKVGNEIEIDACFQNGNIAIPFFISWWSYSHPFNKDGHGMQSYDFGIHFLCFSLHFEYINWSARNGKKR